MEAYPVHPRPPLLLEKGLNRKGAKTQSEKWRPFKATSFLAPLRLCGCELRF
jgi:hypothetical protein